MSYKYVEVVDLIKESKRNHFKPSVWLKILIVVGISGWFLFCLGPLISSSHNETLRPFGVFLFVTGFIMVWAFVLFSFVIESKHRIETKKEIDDLLIDIKYKLRNIGIRTKEDVITLQTEVQKSIEQSDKQWEKALSTIKWAFNIFCITPISFTLSAALKPIFESDSSGLALWLELIIKLAIIGVLATTIVVALTQLINSMRKTFGSYAQKCEVNNRLEDMKYLYSK